MKTEKKPRPEIVTNDHLDFLDALRVSGKTNMFGARPYLMDEFPDLGDAEAKTVLSYWMASFSERSAA